ncbi:MAG TPA: hypothetical protein VIP11_03240 [Gemmatimonadaceae bacterium]
MPDDLPVGVRSLVEEERADGEARFTEHRAGTSSQNRTHGERDDARVVEEIACAATPGASDVRYAAA